MNKMDGLVLIVREMIESDAVDFTVLAKKSKGFEKYFTNTKPGKVNYYDNGVMSVAIEGMGLDKPSTLGYLPMGGFSFNTGANQETMHFVKGDLLWAVGGDDLIAPKEHDTLVIPPRKDLILEVKEQSIYICDYQRK